MSDTRDKKLKDELNNLMQNMEGILNSNDNIQAKKDEDLIINKSIDKLKQDKISTRVPFEEYDKNFKIQAKDIIESMYDFYLDFGVIKRPEYLEKKSGLDGLNMSNIFLQLKLTKVVLQKVVDEISSGNVHPRIIEAYSTLNTQFSDIIKSQANYMLFLEESYKKARFETIEYTNNKNSIDANHESQAKSDNTTYCDVEKDSEFFLTADPSKLIEEIKVNSPMTYEEAKSYRSNKSHDSDLAKRLVNPSAKDDLIILYDIDPSTIITDKDDDINYAEITDMI